ncbi:hypothetical protein [Mangrovibacterium sp.]|uniref:hypothetical protein n=1 Tax=Mangrovibacterium sp. TaxID=1961364 RepID=UPI003565FD03
MDILITKIEDLIGDLDTMLWHLKKENTSDIRDTVSHHVGLYLNIPDDLKELMDEIIAKHGEEKI